MPKYVIASNENDNGPVTIKVGDPIAGVCFVQRGALRFNTKTAKCGVEYHRDPKRAIQFDNKPQADKLLRVLDGYARGTHRVITLSKALALG